jgi:hypothetical protein
MTFRGLIAGRVIELLEYVVPPEQVRQLAWGGTIDFELLHGLRQTVQPEVEE